MRANPPRIGWIVGGLITFLIVVLALGTHMVVVSEWGASMDPVRASWFLGGIVTIAFCGGISVLLIVWHAFAQREVTISEDRVHVRRWIEVFAGKPGETRSMRDVTNARFFVKGAGAKLLILAGDVRMLMSIWFWSMEDALALREAFEQRGIPTDWSIPR